MPIASALIIPDPALPVVRMVKRIETVQGVVSCDTGPKGIAVVLETDDMDEMKIITAQLNGQKGVIDVQLAYLNWEDIEEAGISIPENEQIAKQ